MKFSDIIGHQEQIDALRSLVDMDRIPHALLLSGPAGIGKLALARAFAQYIHCTNKTNGDACGKCPACLQHQSLNNADMHFAFPIIKKASPKMTISDDYMPQWREFIAEAPYASYEKWLETLDAGNSQPQIYVEESANILHKMNLSNFSAKYKIMLIWLPEKLREEAANKLLKIIEEPFGDTKFILVSNEPQAILSTIFSRTQRINLKKLTVAQISGFLTSSIGIDAAMADEIARISNGNINNAIANVSLSTESEMFREMFQEVMRKAYSRDVRYLKDWSDKIAGMGREKERRFLSYCSRMIRENFIYNFKIPQINYLNTEEQKFSSRFAPFINERNVEKIITEIDKAESDIARNANAKIVLFDFCLKLMYYIKS